MEGSPLMPLKCSLYYNNNLVEIAARVVEEFRAGDTISEFSDGDDAISGMENDKSREAARKEEETKDVVKVEAEEEEDFEFAFAPTEMAFSPISADEVFCNGKIRPIFPVHKRNLSTGDAGILCRNSNSSCMQAVKARLPLRKLLIEGRETEKLESDSETGAEETYCVWEPKLGDDAGDGGGCTKSNKSSTATAGSFKWWKHLLSTPKRRYCRFT